MIRNNVSLFFVLCILCIVSYSQCYKILAIISTSSYSHQIPFRSLWLELHARGHEIVLVTTNPIPNINLPNFTQIDVSQIHTHLKMIDFVKLRIEKLDWMNVVDNLIPIFDNQIFEVFESTEMKKLYAPNSNVTFDIFLTEFIYVSPIYAFAHRFNASLIGLCSLGLHSFNEIILGGLVFPSHEYTWEMEEGTGINLPFFKRLNNFIKMWHFQYYLNSKVSKYQKIAEKYLGPLPPLLDIMSNTSMLFINQADVITPGRPKLPNMITFNSFHIIKNLPPLPKDIQKFLDEAKQGFIYFSLGSNINSSTLPEEIKCTFLDVFRKLPYKIIWKNEQNLNEKFNNIYTGNWLPQQAILAHPNIKLFIYQGGVQSTEEAIEYGVPIIGFPILADQIYQIRRMETLGIGKYLKIATFTREQLENAINEVIINKEYKERILNIRKQIRDVPYDGVKHLAWWTEYVVRTKGAPHLRSTLILEPWYQRFDLDIIIFLTIITFIIVLYVLHIITKCFIYFAKYCQFLQNKKTEN